MTHQAIDQAREAVREHYGTVARTGAGCCSAGGCSSAQGPSLKLGYSAEDLASVPEGADMGLGCGNPQAIAVIQPGETVLDFGSGGGLDCFLAAKQVGSGGRVIGVDMTPEMIAKARGNARKLDATNVEFRLGEIEHLPVADGTVDVILSNCVVNLSPDKAAVFQEAFRVLRPGGRIAISDIVTIAEMPADLRVQVAAFTGCISGAAGVAEIERLLQDAGFTAIRIQVNLQSRTFIRDWMPGSGAEQYVASATIEAIKPPASEARA